MSARLLRARLPFATTMRAAALVAALLVSFASAARDDDRYQGYFQAWLAAGDTLGHQDAGFGLVNRNGWGGGLGVRGGIPFEIVDGITLGPWAGGESLGGPMSASYDDGSIYFTWRFELGAQASFPAFGYRFHVRLGKEWMADSATQDGFADPGSFSTWLLRVRTDFKVWSIELGAGVGEFSHEMVTFRYRLSGPACPGFMLEHYSRSGFGQTAGTHARVFWSIDF